MGSEQEEYRWMKAEHFELDKQINTRLRDAKVRFSRPGDGISPSEYINLLDYKFRDDLEANTKIFLKDLYIE